MNIIVTGPKGCGKRTLMKLLPHEGYNFIEASGNIEHLKCLVDKRIQCEAAIFIVDAAEADEKVFVYLALLRVLGIENIIVTVNKMDIVEYDMSQFVAIQQVVGDCTCVPVCADKDENITNHSEWYDGPTLLSVLDSVPEPLPQMHKPLRLPIQDVYGAHYVGKIQTGMLYEGDTINFALSGLQATVDTVDPSPAQAGQATSFTTVEIVEVGRGEMVWKKGELPPVTSKEIRGELLWWRELEVDSMVIVKVNQQEVVGRIAELDVVNHVTTCVIMLTDPVASDANNPFTILQGRQTVGGGIIF